jgi:NCS1 family nucleobase:cation symporter-1
LRSICPFIVKEGYFMADDVRTFSVERHSIDFIPASERHGSIRSLFTLWFASNMQLTTVVTGVAVVAVGLPLLWAFVAIVVGNVLGGIVMALHSAQGPRLGLPQMIQSRAQFGFYGAILPMILVILLYIGFFASSAVLGGQALAGWTGLPMTLSIIIVSGLCAILAIYGYDYIHRYSNIVSVIYLLGFLYLTIRLLILHPLTSIHTASSLPSFGLFLLAVSIVATWQITYGPYVADYSRYLPEHTSVGATFWTTYLGSVISSVWMMILGAIAAVVAGSQFNNNSVVYLAEQAGSGLVGVFYAIIILGIISGNVLNLYGTFLTATTIANAERLRTDIRNRIALVVVTAIVATAIALFGQGNFLDNYTNFLLLLLYFLVPWSAINLTDFYLMRHEHYDIAAIFDAHGVYGAVNWRALLAYAVAIICEVPFMSTTLYTGPLVSLLGGADISWIIGVIVAALMYYMLMRSRITTAPATNAPDDTASSAELTGETTGN